MSRLKQTASEPLVILFVDDDKVFRERLCRAFRDRGCEAHHATAAETVDLARTISPDLVLLDLKMPEIGGLDLIHGIKKLDSTISVIILTGYGSIATAMQALKLGADHYLAKPADAEQILDAYKALNADAIQKHTPMTVPSLARVEWEHIQRVLSDCEGRSEEHTSELQSHSF